MKYKLIPFLLLSIILSGCSTYKHKKQESEFPPGTIFLHPDVSSWPVTTKLTPKVSGNTIVMDFDKKNVWPVAGKTDGGVCNANAWIIFNYKGQYYAATWEWLAKGQPVKKLKDPIGSHIKRDKVIPRSYNPAVGEKVGLMVSGLIRSGPNNVMERSNVVWVEWQFKK